MIIYFNHIFDIFILFDNLWQFIFDILFDFSGGGSIALAGDGGLRQWQITNTVNHLAHVPDSFFAIRFVNDLFWFKCFPSLLLNSENHRRNQS